MALTYKNLAYIRRAAKFFAYFVCILLTECPHMTYIALVGNY
jgi:hypothetical protein